MDAGGFAPCYESSRIFEICFQKKLTGAKEAELAVLPPTPFQKDWCYGATASLHSTNLFEEKK